MGFQKIALLIIVAPLACGSAALAGDGHSGIFKGGVGGVARPHSPSKKHIFIVRRPLPIGQAPAFTGTAGFGASSSSINSRIDSRL
jgi:hypothetical protein